MTAPKTSASVIVMMVVAAGKAAKRPDPVYCASAVWLRESMAACNFVGGIVGDLAKSRLIGHLDHHLRVHRVDYHRVPDRRRQHARRRCRAGAIRSGGRR